MSPHCRRHPPLHLVFIIIPLFHLFLLLHHLTLMRPFPLSRIDSPFRPPGHEPPLFPPSPSFSSLSFLSFSLLFSFHLNIFVPLSISQSLYLAVFTLLFLPFPFSPLLAHPLFTISPVPFIHPSIYLFAHTYTRIRARTYPSRSVDRSLSFSFFFSFHPLSLSHGAPQGSFSS